MGINKIVEKGVFLDRDGIINPNVFYPNTGEWESPRVPAEFELFPWVIPSLRHLIENNFKLFLVSNQPSYAKGKTSMENIKAIQQKLHSSLIESKIFFTEYYYCYHHPRGIVPELTVACECRKPGTIFLKEAERKYSLNMSMSWMIGDRDTDIICGQTVGVRTILILNNERNRENKNIESNPEFKAANLEEAANIITQHI